LALLNLLRGNTYKIQSGQIFATLLKNSGFNFTPIEKQHGDASGIRPGWRDVF